jgi:hypothetical protein
LEIPGKGAFFLGLIQSNDQNYCKHKTQGGLRGVLEHHENAIEDYLTDRRHFQYKTPNVSLSTVSPFEIFRYEFQKIFTSSQLSCPSMSTF